MFTTVCSTQQAQRHYVLTLGALTTLCVSSISIQVCYYKIQCLKVGRVWSLLRIHPEFDDVTHLCGWNKFRGLRVECENEQKAFFVFRSDCETSQIGLRSKLTATCSGHLHLTNIKISHKACKHLSHFYNSRYK